VNEVNARLPELSRFAKTPPQAPVLFASGEIFVIGNR